MGPYVIQNMPTTCNLPDLQSIQAQAESQARAAGVYSEVSDYPHHIYMMPNEMNGPCTFGGVSYIGGSPGYSWINSGGFAPGPYLVNVALTHEFGHQLELMHSQSIESDGITLVEYGDNSCPMGDEGWVFVDFNAIHRIQLGFMPLTNIQQAVSSGIYHVSSTEPQMAGIQALQIQPPGTGHTLYVSYRQPVGLDANLPVGFTGGVSIHFWPGGVTKSQLATANAPYNGALSDPNPSNPGADTYSWSFLGGAVTIQQLSHDSTSATVKIDFENHPLGNRH